MTIEEEEKKLREYLATFTVYTYHGEEAVKREIEIATRQNDRNILEKFCSNLPRIDKFFAEDDEEAAKEIRKHKRSLKKKTDDAVKVYVENVFETGSDIKYRLKKYSI